MVDQQAAAIRNYKQFSSSSFFIGLLTHNNYYNLRFLARKPSHFNSHFLECLNKFDVFSLSKYNKYNYRFIRSRKSLKRLRYLNSLNLKRKPR